MDKGKFPLFGLKLFGKFGIFFFFLLFVFSIVREYSSHRCLRTNESIDRSIDQDFSKRATNVFHGNREGGKENKGREEKRAHCKINKLRQFRESDRILFLLLSSYCCKFTNFSFKSFTNYSVQRNYWSNWWNWISTIISNRGNWC